MTDFLLLYGTNLVLGFSMYGGIEDLERAAQSVEILGRLPVQSFLNVFKYLNIFTYISLRDLYTNYLNIDLFGYPVGIRSISGIAMLPIGLLLICVCITVHCHKKPAAGKDLLGRAAYQLNSLTDKGLHHLRLLGMEIFR